MSLKYFRIKVSQAIKGPFSRRRRKKRMDHFTSTMGIKGGERIIDLGGTPIFWDTCDVPLELTIVNLPGTMNQKPQTSHHKITVVEGDATNLTYPDQSFDIAFSNSVIEHVGPVENQEAFAREVHRVAPRHWVQTPSIWFPIEAHTFMPFWWFYPPALKRYFIRGWRKKLPGWCEMVEGTTVLMRREIVRMFPMSKIWTERLAGIPKSYVAYKAE